MLQQALTNPNVEYTINAFVRAIKQTEYSQQSSKAFQRIDLDDGQTTIGVKIWQGKGQPLSQSHIGQRLQFKIKGYISKFDQNVYLSGFWNSRAQINQGQSPATTNRQTPTKNTARDYAQEQLERNRSMALSYGLEHLKLPYSEELFKKARGMAEFIKTGQTPLDAKVAEINSHISDPDQSIVGDDEPEPTDDDIPLF